MGIPGFFRWLVESFPDVLLSLPPIDPQSEVDVYADGETCDFLYLDMNGVIHNSTHQDGDDLFPESYEAAGNRIHFYMDKIVNACKPQRTLFIAVDGVAPRAKMNQQRQRRYIAGRSKKDVKTLNAKLRAKKEKMDKSKASLTKEEPSNSNPVENQNESKENDEESTQSEEDDNDFLNEKEIINEDAVVDEEYIKIANQSPFFGFDSNQITPGTPFMELVAGWVHSYAQSRSSSGRGFWENLEIVVTDSSVPGEGEHKLVDFARLLQKDSNNANLKHVFYGPDADLIMLGLSLHEPNFWVLRENVFGDPCTRCSKVGHNPSDCPQLNPKNLKKDENDFPENRTVHIFNLPYNVTEKDIRAFFEKCGHITEVRIIIDSDTFKPKGYGFVEFSDHEEALNALKRTNHILGPCKVHIRFAKMVNENDASVRRISTVDVSDEKLVQFQMLTGLGLEECMAFLVEAGGNLELATATFFDPEGAAEQTLIQRELLRIADMEQKEKILKENNQPIPPPSLKKVRRIKFQMLRLRVLGQHLVERLNTEKKSEKTEKEGETELEYSLIDDFLLYCMLGGNDFLPPMEIINIAEGGVNTLTNLYRNWQIQENNPKIRFTKGSGEILWKEFASYLQMESEMEFHQLAYRYRRAAKPRKLNPGPRPPRTNTEGKKKRTKKTKSVDAAVDSPSSPALALKEPTTETPLATEEKEGKVEVEDEKEKIEEEEDKQKEEDQLNEEKLKDLTLEKKEGEETPKKKKRTPRKKKPKVKTEKSEEPQEGEENNENRVMEADPYKNWKENYYGKYFPEDVTKEDFIPRLCTSYLLTLQWTLFYYRRGLCSWSWFYNYHHPPLFCDLANFLTSHYDEFEKIVEETFKDPGVPFKPFEQLMAVLPPSSGEIALPFAFHSLMTDPQSPIIDFFPTSYTAYTRGRHSILGLPFIEEKRLLQVVAPLEEQLEENDRKRNQNREKSTLYLRKDPKSQHFASHFERVQTN
eukprot:TRINITY_DN4310_c0_g1_i1.p1 TRINITY_DN4310_c0_g1~~TRINITY_DN4310_c0_g1_i1.p1  ORF type:complete len:983 (-),score=344.11 TRINITY_DN4310_c0_g1_i1:6-2954(-)